MVIDAGRARENPGNAGSRPRHSGFTLVEFLVCFTIAAFTVTAIITGYILASRRTDWTTASSAAQRMAARRLEQLRAARWDPFSDPVIDDLNSLVGNPTTTNVQLELPVTATNLVTATLRTAVADVSANPPLRMIQVDCVWTVQGRGPFTNTVVSYRAPG